MPKYTLSVNGKMMSVEADADTPLLWVLRDNLNLMGTKFGCGVAQCGACTVHMNGNAVRSCALPVSAVANNKIVTIEGLSATGDHPLQQAWEELGCFAVRVLPGRPNNGRCCLVKKNTQSNRRGN